MRKCSMKSLTVASNVYLEFSFCKRSIMFIFVKMSADQTATARQQQKVSDHQQRQRQAAHGRMRLNDSQANVAV